MNDLLNLLFILLIIWLVLYLIMEFRIINKRKNDVKNIFLELDDLFIKRFNVLSKLLDIIKKYDKNQFDSFGSKLYDYINNYDEYDINSRLKINEDLSTELKKILLVSKVYPEILYDDKFAKLEKQLIKLNKLISKLHYKYNDALIIFISRKRIFPSNLICVIFKFYSYNYFNLRD